MNVASNKNLDARPARGVEQRLIHSGRWGTKLRRISPNTVHFGLPITIRICRRGDGRGARSLVGKPLILRLTARGFRRPRLEPARTSRISVMASSAILVAS